MKDVKEHILDIAKRRFERFGYKKTTVDEICSDGKISKKTLYQFFKSKEELFIFLFSRETLSIRTILFQRVGNIDSPSERIIKMLKVGMEVFHENSFVVKAIKDEDRLYSPFLTMQYHTLVEEGIVNICRDILDQGIERGVFRKIDTRIVAYIIFKLFQSFSYAKTATLSNDKKNEDHQTNVLLDFIMNAIMK